MRLRGFHFSRRAAWQRAVTAERCVRPAAGRRHAHCSRLRLVVLLRVVAALGVVVAVVAVLPRVPQPLHTRREYAWDGTGEVGRSHVR